MAAAITTTSTTLEGQLLEVLTSTQDVENDAARNPQGRNFVTLSVNTDTKTATATVTLPLEFAVGTTGKIELTATSYLT